VRYWWHRTRENILIRIAWALPRELAYWCAIRVGVHATVGRYSDQVVTELKVFEALQRWET
jgi:hypothetical protein